MRQYQLLAMLKRGHSIVLEDVEALITRAMETGTQTVAAIITAGTPGFRVTSGSGTLTVHLAAGPHVVEESTEIADRFGVDCRGSSQRIETSGHDPDLELINTWVMFVEALEKRGDMILFDPSIDAPMPRR